MVGAVGGLCSISFWRDLAMALFSFAAKSCPPGMIAVAESLGVSKGNA